LLATAAVFAPAAPAVAVADFFAAGAADFLIALYFLSKMVKFSCSGISSYVT